jgi:hypothetical protein
MFGVHPLASSTAHCPQNSQPYSLIPNPHPDLSFLELANNALSGSVPTDFCLAYYADLDLSGNPGLTPVDCPPDLVTGQDAEGGVGKELPKDDGAYY